MAASTSLTSRLPNYDKLGPHDPPVVGQAISGTGTDLAYHNHYPRRLYVGSVGNVTLMDMDGNSVQFIGVPTGTTIEMYFQQVVAATASSMVALY